MRVDQMMTKDPACCSRQTPLREVAQLMVANDCGCIPVVEDGKPVGVITDRDICCRAVAEGRNPLDLTAGDCMTGGCIAVRVDSSLDDCCYLLEDKQIRRLVVVDESGRCCGILSQGDIAARRQDLAGEIVQAVSRPTDTPSNVDLQ